MKRVLLAITLFLSTLLAANAQKAIKVTKEKLADIFLLDDTLLIYTVKEADGQYLYTEKRGEPSSYKKHSTLNAGAVNAFMGTGVTGREIYVYQKLNQDRARIAFYRWDGTTFWKTGEKPFPEIKNHSHNLGAYLSPGQNTLILAADLRRTRGYDDLYLSKWEHSQWTTPVGFGAPPNTREPEFSPFLANDSIFFSRQEGENAYVYAVPLGSAAGGGEATKLSGPVNQENAFTTGYKRVGGRKMWITRTPDGTYNAYLTGPDLNTAPAPEPEKSTPAVAAMVEPASLTFRYGMNIVYLTDDQTQELDSFLAQQPDAAVLVIKGFSDNVGSDVGKQRVARQRAVLFQMYVERRHAARQFSFQTQSEVLKAVGPGHRRVEITVQVH